MNPLSIENKGGGILEILVCVFIGDVQIEEV